MKKFLGIELGSTRIKAVLIDESACVLAQGGYEWENMLVDGLWSYSLDKVEEGLQVSFAELSVNYKAKYGEALQSVDAMGISAMMHGYLAFDKYDNLLAPFRTWRNTNTDAAAAELSELFSFNVPMRWSISHYYQAILNGEEHIQRVAFFTTLAGYVHYRLTGNKVLGIGDASGMFPIRDNDYDGKMIEKFNALMEEKGIDVDVKSLMPKVLCAGEGAGVLTDDGARLLDPTGNFKAGCLTCAPEGDAGTGMVATNSITPRTANISAGTSAFLMAVLEKPLSSYYKEIDIVTTPHGSPVAMVHVNNFASEITAWTNLFDEVVGMCGGEIARGKLFDLLYAKSLEADDNCGGLVGYNFLAGEPIVDVASGTPLIARAPDGRLTLANFMKMHIYSALGSLALGCELLSKEDVAIDSVYGHGGFFKSPFVGQSAMSAAIGAPVTVMKNAGEGGAWGIAILALFAYSDCDDLEKCLADIFDSAEKSTVSADEKEINSFKAFLEKYKRGLAIEKLAADVI